LSRRDVAGAEARRGMLRAQRQHKKNTDHQPLSCARPARRSLCCACCLTPNALLILDLLFSVRV
jgi:hypothetical protein